MNKLLNNLLGMYKQAKLNKKAEQQNLKQIFEEAMGNREPIIETANGVFYFEPKGDKIVFGTATNVGISQDYVFDYDFDMSFDQNIQGMAEEVLEKEGYYTESSKRTKMKRKVGTIEQQINDKKYSIDTENDDANKLLEIIDDIVYDYDVIKQALDMTKNQKEDEFSVVTLSPEKDKVLGVKYIKKDEVYDYKPNQNEYALAMTRDTGFADTDYQLQPMIMVVRSWNEGRKFYATKKNRLNKKAEEDLIEVGWGLYTNDEYEIKDNALYGDDKPQEVNETFWNKINNEIDKVESWFLKEGYKKFFTKVRDEGHGKDSELGGTAWMTENQLKDFMANAEQWDTEFVLAESSGTLDFGNIPVDYNEALSFKLKIYVDDKDLDELGIESKRVSKNKKLSSKKTRKSLHKKAISGFSADVMEINERKLDEIRNTAKDMGDEIWARINENIVKIIAYGYEDGKLKIVYREPYYGKEEIEEMYENADEVSLADFQTLELQREAKISHNLSKKADEDLNKEYKLLGNGLPTFDFNKKIIDFLDGINKKFDKFCVKIYGKIVCFNEIKDKKLITDKGEEFDYRYFGSGLLLKIYNKINNSKQSSNSKTLLKKAEYTKKDYLNHFREIKQDVLFDNKGNFVEAVKDLLGFASSEYDKARFPREDVYNLVKEYIDDTINFQEMIHHPIKEEYIVKAKELLNKYKVENKIANSIKTLHKKAETFDVAEEFAKKIVEDNKHAFSGHTDMAKLENNAYSMFLMDNASIKEILDEAKKIVSEFDKDKNKQFKDADLYFGMKDRALLAEKVLEEKTKQEKQSSKAKAVRKKAIRTFDQAIKDDLLKGNKTWEDAGKDIRDSGWSSFSLDKEGTIEMLKLTEDEIAKIDSLQQTAKEKKQIAEEYTKQYYAGKFDLETLHDKLVKIFGDIGTAFEWLRDNDEKIKRNSSTKKQAEGEKYYAVAESGTNFGSNDNKEDLKEEIRDFVVAHKDNFEKKEKIYLKESDTDKTIEEIIVRDILTPYGSKKWVIVATKKQADKEYPKYLVEIGKKGYGLVYDEDAIHEFEDEQEAKECYYNLAKTIKPNQYVVMSKLIESTGEETYEEILNSELDDIEASSKNNKVGKQATKFLVKFIVNGETYKKESIRDNFIEATKDAFNKIKKTITKDKIDSLPNELSPWTINDFDDIEVREIDGYGVLTSPKYTKEDIKENLYKKTSNIKMAKKITNKQATIKHENGVYNVYSESGKCLGKGYKTKEEAEKRLKQVEYFKHKKASVIKKAKNLSEIDGDAEFMSDLEIGNGMPYNSDDYDYFEVYKIHAKNPKDTYNNKYVVVSDDGSILAVREKEEDIIEITYDDMLQELRWRRLSNRKTQPNKRTSLKQVVISKMAKIKK